MGCWNATCNITNLPILGGDEVVLIPLLKVSDKTQFNTCYPTDNFVPLGFPIFGEYNEYGGIENAKTSAVNEKHLRKFEYYFEHRDGVQVTYDAVTLQDSLDDFVCQVLCCSDGCYIKMDNKYFYKDGMALVTYMLVHKMAYDRLLTEMAGRIPYNYTDDYKTALCTQMTGRLMDISKKFAIDDAMDEIRKTAYLHICRDEICNNICSYPNCFHNIPIWSDIVDVMLGHPDEVMTILQDITYLKIWYSVLSHLRKGYLCDCGAGSQSSEMRLHLIVADCIRDLVQKMKKDHEWESEESDADTIYLW